MASFAISEEGDGTQNLDDHEEQPLSSDDATLRNPKRKKTKGEPKGRLKGVLEMNVPKKKASSKQTRNDQNNQQGEVSIHENLVLGGTSNTHQPTKKGFVDLLNAQFSGVNPNQAMRSWPDMSAPPGSIECFCYPRHQSFNCLQVLGNATGSISSKLGESQSSQVLANAIGSISSMLSESQSSQGEEVRARVNKWAEKATNGLIESVLPPESITNKTKLLLANALYFKGIWKEEFDEN
ncbi:hypothetical protein GIB67_007769 [Kingdonia uniflora]|uniref:Serpin domain-containing protein n=1 Tax=Kingdonia uniflora TaxID=39325 RepID=A0A7J7N2I4_9MAGN|nr:hypothetical protein GIB67_007769 [Kingdonia uniflora]